jgi:pyruvate formate lyase activating enzyme
MKRDETLHDTISRPVREGTLYERMADGWVRCVACGHRCPIGPGKAGVCRVRFNRGGILRVPHGYIGGLQIDPIEKKPFFHAFPGSQTLSFGMLGCDYHCAYCQNWVTSQALRDPGAGSQPTITTADQIVALAREHRVPVLTSTYNEPLITSEWAVHIFSLARLNGIAGAYVSNGNGTPEVLEFLRPHIRLFKIDLKSFRQKRYQQLGGRLEHVLETIRTLVGWGIWVEVVTLVVPEFNDSNEELTEVAEFLVSVSPDIPWHVTAFHAAYRMSDPGSTPPATLLRAAGIGRKTGLHFVYAGNLPGMVSGLENTHCPSCSTLLIERLGFRVIRNTLVAGACPSCSTPLPGIWS